MALPQPDLHSTCLVTGASSGIGADVARSLARLGHHTPRSSLLRVVERISPVGR